uniref:small integral membrane protein 15 isoform X2 n=1 Tax=Callithrix jacchus TaxID=9483 RepID=UPI00159D5507|nr:small integral membrane protein 15 isoform X2 [Callithrix jacchus]
MGVVCRSTSGSKAKVHSRFGTVRVLKPLHASSVTTWSPQDAVVSGSSPEGSAVALTRPARPHLPLPGYLNTALSPPRTRPRPISRGPKPHAAMAQPETDPWTSSRSAGGSRRLWAGRKGRDFRLPASGQANLNHLSDVYSRTQEDRQSRVI